ncbi:MAG: trehalose-phosphatase [Phototrophicales bacterium]|nr:MAG: trehalose-phosphatase [Phototrophicales bacterium]
MHTQSPSIQHWSEVTETVLVPLLQAERLGLITDMDGTISHVADTPEAAVVTPKNRKILSTMVLMLPLVATISGRSARDLHSRVAIPGMVYVGNHGLERWQNGGRVLNDYVRRYRKALVSALDELRPHLTIGMWIEDKYATASVHYRLTPNPDEAAKTLEPIIQEIVQKYGLRANAGRRLFEIRPPIDANKGTALLDLFNEYKLDAVIYLGDDITDIDAMKMNRRLRDTTGCHTLNVAVISDNGDQEQQNISEKLREYADIYVRDVNDVEQFLDWLLEALCKQRN